MSRGLWTVCESWWAMTEEGIFVVSTAPVTLDGDVMKCDEWCDVQIVWFRWCLEETSLEKWESIWNCWEDIVWPALAEQVVALTREARAHISWDFFRLLSYEPLAPLPLHGSWYATVQVLKTFELDGSRTEFSADLVIDFSYRFMPLYASFSRNSEWRPHSRQWNI